jgi:glyoxylase-like metal-dependent hydrolase (beta-lactamase superfamily II)
MTVRTIIHKHTNMYLIGDERFILFDCGWQDSFPAIKAALREYGIGFEQIRGVFASHFHPDHAGTLELLRRHGVEPLILERQMPHIAWLNEFFKQSQNDPSADYAPLDDNGIMPITHGEAQKVLAECGIEGKVLCTSGHSDDSISLVIDDMAFTGDLPPYSLAEQSGKQTASSWRELIACGVRTIYPAHGIKYAIEVLL